MTHTLFQGVTFRVERGEMVIARILHGSSIDRQGMLHAGDVILEVNGREVGSNPHELQELLRDCSGSIALKVLPSYRETPAPPQVRKQEAAPSNQKLQCRLCICSTAFVDGYTPWCVQGCTCQILTV